MKSKAQEIFLLEKKLTNGYYDQNHQGLGLKINIIEELMYYFTLSEEEARNICGAFYLEKMISIKKLRI